MKKFSNDEFENLICSIFTHYYRQIFGDKFFRVNIEKMNQRRSIELFKERISKIHKFESLGVNFFDNFILFNFLSKIEVGINLPVAIGPTSIQRYKDREETWLYDIEYWSRELGIKRFKQEKLNENIELNSNDEFYKKKFHNTEKGFFICLENTTLADPKSESCKTCKHIIECKKILKVNYELLYKERWN